MNARDISHWADWPDSDLIDQAAGASQSHVLLEDEIVREAIALNIIQPLRQALAKARGEWE
jgi:hypothetical protein